MSGYWDPWIPKNADSAGYWIWIPKKIYGSGYRIWIPKKNLWIWIPDLDPPKKLMDLDTGSGFQKKLMDRIPDLDPKKKPMDLDTGSGSQKETYGSGYRIWIPKNFSWIWIQVSTHPW